jgi:hypothetical protein
MDVHPVCNLAIYARTACMGLATEHTGSGKWYRQADTAGEHHRVLYADAVGSACLLHAEDNSGGRFP